MQSEYLPSGVSGYPYFNGPGRSEGPPSRIQFPQQYAQFPPTIPQSMNFFAAPNATASLPCATDGVARRHCPPVTPDPAPEDVPPSEYYEAAERPRLGPALLGATVAGLKATAALTGELYSWVDRYVSGLCRPRWMPSRGYPAMPFSSQSYVIGDYEYEVAVYRREGKKSCFRR